jgi:hypothetical protein
MPEGFGRSRLPCIHARFHATAPPADGPLATMGPRVDAGVVGVIAQPLDRSD